MEWIWGSRRCSQRSFFSLLSPGPGEEVAEGCSIVWLHVGETGCIVLKEGWISERCSHAFAHPDRDWWLRRGCSAPDSWGAFLRAFLSFSPALLSLLFPSDLPLNGWQECRTTYIVPLPRCGPFLLLSVPCCFWVPSCCKTVSSQCVPQVWRGVATENTECDPC